MKRKRFLSSILIGILFVAGCAENPEKYEEENVISDYEESEVHVTGKIGEYITIDADVQSRPKEDAYEVIHCKTDTTDNRDLYKDVFYAGEDPSKIASWDIGKVYEDGSFFISWGEYFDNGTLEYDQNGDPWSTRFVSGSPNNEFSYIYDYEQNIIQTSLFYSIYPSSKELIGESSFGDWESSPESLNISDEVELAGYSKAEAIADVTELLKKLKIDSCEEPLLVYAIRREDWPDLYNEVIQWYESEISEETRKSLENDEFYYILWLDELNGIPVATGNRSASTQGSKGMREYPEDGVYNRIFINKDRILDFSRSSAKYVETEREEKKPVISLREAIERLDEHYGSLLMQTEHTLYRANFCYVPDKAGEEETKIRLNDGEDHGYTVYDVDMIPAWCLEVRYQGRVDDPNDIWHEMIYVNSQTGEFIQ